VTENNEVKESVKNSVKERIKYIVQKISNESTKKVIKNLKEELKGKAKEALDETLKNVPEEIEKKLEGSIKKVTEELVKDNIEKEDVLSKIEPFEKSLTKYFSSLPKTVSPIVFTPLIKAAIITGTVITVAIIATALIIPPPTGGWIEGKVFTPDGEPIGGVQVYIEDGPSSRRVYTDDDGYYKLKDLIPGIYGIVADISDYGVQRIDDIVVERGEGVWMDFRTSTPTPTPRETGTKEGALEFSLAHVETYFTGDEDKFCSHLADTIYFVEEGGVSITKEEVISMFKENKPFTYGYDFSEFTMDDYLENYSTKIMDYEEYSKEEWDSVFPIDGWTPDADDFFFIGLEVKPGKEGFIIPFELLRFMVTYQNEKWEIILLDG
jgi:hypothetical protein